jgi:hypothetical protein
MFLHCLIKIYICFFCALNSLVGLSEVMLCILGDGRGIARGDAREGKEES